MKNVKPSGDRLIVLPLPAEEKTKSGIIIPEQAKDKPSRGTVVSVGPGLTDKPMEYKAGDKIIYSKYAGTELVLDEVDHLMLRMDDVFATYED